MFSTATQKFRATFGLLGLSILIASNGIAFGQPVPGYTELPNLPGYSTRVEAVANGGSAATGWAVERVLNGAALAQRWAPTEGLTTYTGGAYPDRGQVVAVTGDGEYMAGLGVTEVGPGTLLRRAFRLRASGDIEPIGVFAGDEESEATAISGDGQVVVGKSIRRQFEIRERAFYWSPSTQMVQIPDLRPNGVMTTARDVSATGQFVVGSSKSDNVFAREYAYLWSMATGSVELMTPVNIANSVATGVNGDGSVATGFASILNQRSQPVRWINGAMEYLGTVEGYDNGGNSLAISDDGMTIVGHLQQTQGGHPDSAFVYTDAWGMLQANDFFVRHGVMVPGLVRSITDVSPDGTAFSIRVYDAFNDSIVVIPAPSSVVAFLFVCAFRRRRPS